MRQLRVVGLGDDTSTVILEDPIRHERFVVSSDERLRAAARGDISRLGQMEIEVTSPLRPRDIQARIRAGESVEQVATTAGVTEAHVERFAYPVLLERSRVAEMAGRAHPLRGDRIDGRTLAEIVSATFSARGQDYEEARWEAWKGEDGRWTVALGWTAGRSDVAAHWAFVPGPAGGTVEPRDDHARDVTGEAPSGPRRADGRSGRETRAEEPTLDEAAAEEEMELPGALTATGEVAPPPHSGRRDAARADGTRADATRTDGTRADGTRADGTRTDGTRTDGTRTDGTRTDGTRTETGRTDTSRTDTSRTDTSRTDTARTDTARTDTSRPAAGPARQRGEAARSGDQAETRPAARPDARGAKAARPARTVPDQRTAARRATRDTPEAPAADAEETERARPRKGRHHPIVPSWEDVLLGVRSPKS